MRASYASASSPAKQALGTSEKEQRQAALKEHLPELPSNESYVLHGREGHLEEIALQVLRARAESGKVTPLDWVYSPQHEQWLRAEDVPGIRSVFYRWYQGRPAEPVRVADFSMPIGSMIVFMIKWAIASIPALLILFGLLAAVGVVLAEIFDVTLGHLFW